MAAKEKSNAQIIKEMLGLLGGEETKKRNQNSKEGHWVEVNQSRHRGTGRLFLAATELWTEEKGYGDKINREGGLGSSA